MHWRRQNTSLEPGSAPTRLQEVELLLKADPGVHSEPPVEIQEIDAAAQQYVLAVVDRFRRFGQAG